MVLQASCRDNIPSYAQTCLNTFALIWCFRFSVGKFDFPYCLVLITCRLYVLCLVHGATYLYFCLPISLHCRPTPLYACFCLEFPLPRILNFYPCLCINFCLYPRFCLNVSTQSLSLPLPLSQLLSLISIPASVSTPTSVSGSIPTPVSASTSVSTPISISTSVSTSSLHQLLSVPLSLSQLLSQYPCPVSTSLSIHVSSSTSISASTSFLPLYLSQLLYLPLPRSLPKLLLSLLLSLTQLLSLSLLILTGSGSTSISACTATKPTSTSEISCNQRHAVIYRALTFTFVYLISYTVYSPWYYLLRLHVHYLNSSHLRLIQLTE